MEYRAEKAYRLLYMSDKLRAGESLVKSEVMAELGVPSKTFQRDVDSLRFYFAENGGGDVVYDRRKDTCA
jgi:predicted DNA-binding transcriptional regulator YafY